MAMPFFPFVEQEGKIKPTGYLLVLQINLLLACAVMWNSGWRNNLHNSVTAAALCYPSIGLRRFYAFAVIIVQPVHCLGSKRRLSPEKYAKSINPCTVKSNFDRDYTNIWKPKPIYFALETIAVCEQHSEYY